jgi:hypothetical protein
MSSEVISNVVARYRLAKGLALLPEFKKALEYYVATGGSDLMRAFIKGVLNEILPNGSVAPWYYGLGTAKRNTVKFLSSEGQSLLNSLSPTQIIHDEAKWRSYMVMRLEKWGNKLRTLEVASEASDEERVISVYGWKVIPMPGLTKAKVSGAIEALEQATNKLRESFPQVIYGDVYLATHLQRGKAAWYVPSEDKFYLDVNAKKRFSDIYTITHELGHRWDSKFFKNKDLRTRFWELSTRKEYETIQFDPTLRETVALEVLRAVRARKDGKSVPQLSREATIWISTRYTPGGVKRLSSAYLAGTLSDAEFIKELMGTEDFKVPTDVLLHGPIAVTPYGGTKPSENLAEAFAHYVLGMDLDPELKSILDAAK